jgi:hypothetical protein
VTGRVPWAAPSENEQGENQDDRDDERDDGDGSGVHEGSVRVGRVAAR